MVAKKRGLLDKIDEKLEKKSKKGCCCCCGGK